ncbi:hypothetical protein BGZ54_004102, partial [Gamsiella multidivaricata]
MDTAPYQEVFEACCLLSDLAALLGGDAIEIGECGIKLLGGQRANISLARAIYVRADIYMFDDTLSTVDAHVEKGDLCKAIMSKELLADKAKIFVTHRIQYLAQSTTILLLCDGKAVRARQLPGAKAKTAEVYQLVTGHGSDSSNNTLLIPMLFSSKKHQPCSIRLVQLRHSADISRFSASMECFQDRWVPERHYHVGGANEARQYQQERLLCICKLMLLSLDHCLHPARGLILDRLLHGGLTGTATMAQEG